MHNHENLRYVDALRDVYFHGCSISTSSKKHGVDRRRLSILVNDMPENLPPDSLSSRRFLRTCYKMLSIIANHNYTKLEMQYSITDAIFNMKSYGLCVEEYGVAERTLRGIWMRESPPSSR